MAAKEDLIQWLKEKLIQEQEALRGRHQLLLAEMKAKLHEGAACANQSTEQAGSDGAHAEEQCLHNPVAITETVTSEMTVDVEQTPKTDDTPAEQAGSDGAHAEEQRLHNPVVITETVGTEIKVDEEQTQETDDIQSAYSKRDVSNKKSLRSPRQIEYKGVELLQPVVKSIYFELASGGAILLNVFVLMCEVQYHGADSGYGVGYKAYRPSKEAWPGLGLIFYYLDIFFVCLFALELVVRIGALGHKSIRSSWIWFDTIIVVTSVLSLTIDAGVDTTAIRVVRLGRMLRTVKMLRMMRSLDSLYLLLKSIQASVGALFWSFFLLISAEVAVGLCLSQLLRQYIQDDTQNVSERKEVFLYYGTFTRSMITMSEITLGNWVPSCRTLMENVSEWYGLFYILYNCCFIFAVIRVIQAVFIAETSRVVASDDQVAITRKHKDKTVLLARLQALFDELDLSGDGKLSRLEIKLMGQDDLVRHTMSILEIAVDDLEVLFDLLDSGDGQIDIHEFIHGLSRVKGAAQSLDLVSALQLMHKVNSKLDSMMFTIAHLKASLSGSQAASMNASAGTSDNSLTDFKAAQSRILENASRRAVPV